MAGYPAAPAPAPSGAYDPLLLADGAMAVAAAGAGAGPAVEPELAASDSGNINTLLQQLMPPTQAQQLGLGSAAAGAAAAGGPPAPLALGAGKFGLWDPSSPAPDELGDELPLLPSPGLLGRPGPGFDLDANMVSLIGDINLDVGGLPAAPGAIQRTFSPRLERKQFKIEPGQPPFKLSDYDQPDPRAPLTMTLAPGGAAPAPPGGAAQPSAAASTALVPVSAGPGGGAAAATAMPVSAAAAAAFPDSFEKLTDHQLANIAQPQLQQLMANAGLSPAEVTAVKAKRRRIKNQLSAKVAYGKKKKQFNGLNVANKALSKTVEALQRQNTTLAGRNEQLQNRVAQLERSVQAVADTAQRAARERAAAQQEVARLTAMLQLLSAGGITLPGGHPIPIVSAAPALLPPQTVAAGYAAAGDTAMME